MSVCQDRIRTYFSNLFSPPDAQRVTHNALSFLSDLLFPRHVACGLCDIALGEDFPWNLCPACAAGLAPVGTYGCKGCGRSVGAFALQGLCPHCLGEDRWFAAGRSGYHYNDSAQALVHGLKYHQKPWLAHSMAAQMHPFVLELCEAYDIQCLVPVPIHETRLLERGYNQSGLLAAALSELTGVPETLPLLERTRNTEPQNRLTLPERIRNIQGAFVMDAAAASEGWPERVLLIDDVLTTGNTLNACAKALRQGGVREVFIATYASVTG